MSNENPHSSLLAESNRFKQRSLKDWDADLGPDTAPVWVKKEPAQMVAKKQAEAQADVKVNQCVIVTHSWLHSRILSQQLRSRSHT